jgi:peptide/nickel transport system substrate-binding protein
VSKEIRAQRLFADVLEGRVSRRGLLKRAAALGLSAPVIASLLAACADDDEPEDAPAEAPDDTDADDAEDEVEEPDVDDEEPTDADDEDDEDDEPADTERGGGGNLDLLWWQAPDIINPHLAQGGKDFDASNIVYEALAYVDNDGSLIPRLAAEIPSIDAGTIDPDGMWVTWRLRDDVLWHDGERFDAEDVAFVFEYVSDEATTATTFATYEPVDRVEIDEDFTVTVYFKEPNPGWFVPFVGTQGLILPEHVFGPYTGADARTAPANLEPVGTGPFICTDFRPGDTSFYEMNPNYWQPGKPYFDTIEMKGGGDATSAARAVIITGEADWAWNLQVEADILESIESQGQHGFVLPIESTNNEYILINFADPWTEIDGARAEPTTDHPFLTNHDIRNAIALSIQRDTIADELYGPGGTATAQNLNSPEWAQHPDLEWRFDLEEAAELLDAAGAIDEDGDGVREYNGTPLTILYQTSVNPVRQKNQEIVQDDLNSIGFDVELKSIEASIFFSSDPGNPDTFGHFYSDIQMYTTGPTTPFPANYVLRYASWEIAEQANNWAGQNIFRYDNPEMDEVIRQAQTELDSDEQARLFQEINYISVTDVVEIPIVWRTLPAAVANSLAGYHQGPFRNTPWDIGNWYRE